MISKKEINEDIFYICRRVTQFSNPFTWGEVKILLEKEKIILHDNDNLSIGYEEAYFEGQKDALTEIIRIEKIEGCDEGWRWTKSPWDGTERQPIFIPSLCKNP